MDPFLSLPFPSLPVLSVNLGWVRDPDDCSVPNTPGQNLKCPLPGHLSVVTADKQSCEISLKRLSSLSGRDHGRGVSCIPSDVTCVGQA
ncbi:hypothetical protein MPTK1_6g08850 [Marchantia polymorpha subsp. ruderalis]|uniref:Uncharacterized protein n=2 Tax=Marchantia polymorpha TaxID=3197 RepID=A0AAF6BQ14_MARPO|nr:hypothetical protein MARPO_0060s0034 [Marchantia polymorpha]BBN14098.1 hypothetical protein Mp_6g08850 [Marchantia polymorpha subsp. ruderalis]|eukprot:PTQ36945.1 hypothetical protein MARPO_0060s0034 [Marchantia polymorpha]